jgi:lysophospholipase L1-like esterase
MIRDPILRKGGLLLRVCIQVTVVVSICALLGGCGGENANSEMYQTRMAAFAKEHISPGSKMIIGDSITQRWPDDLLPDDFINRGISGDTSAGVLDRLQFHIEEKPAAIVLFIGVNDILNGFYGDTADNYRQMIDRIRQALPDTRIYIISILPLVNSLENNIVRQVNDRIREVANSYGIPWLNAHDIFEEDGGAVAGYYRSDGIHPNRTGYQVLHDCVIPLLDSYELVVTGEPAKQGNSQTVSP